VTFEGASTPLVSSEADPDADARELVSPPSATFSVA
jgi:hypothetical protein